MAWLSAPIVARGSLDPRGPVAGEIADLWWWMLAVAAVVFLAVLVLLGVSLRSRRTGERVARRLVVAGGVVMPAVVLTAVLVVSVATTNAIPFAAGPGALRVEVTGHQWWWEVRYPDHGFATANEIHLPVGRQVEFTLRSADVIHSFWVPQLGGKIDALPDHPNTLVLQADEPGEYRGVCAEFCGIQHAKMGLLVVAQPRDEFAAWLDAQARPAPPPEGRLPRRGAVVFGAAGCGMCHSVRGTDAAGARAPDLTHFGSRRTLAAAALPATGEHIRDWVADPQSIKEGALMEGADLGASDLAALVAYLEGLE